MSNFDFLKSEWKQILEAAENAEAAAGFKKEAGTRRYDWKKGIALAGVCLSPF